MNVYICCSIVHIHTHTLCVHTPCDLIMNLLCDIAGVACVVARPSPEGGYRGE